MFKVISKEYENAIISNKFHLVVIKGFNSLEIKFNNAEYIKVFKENEIKEFLHNSEYVLYVKDLQKALKDTNIVCFEYKYQNGKKFIAISDLSTFHKILEQSKIQIDENELIEEKSNKAGCIFIITIFIIILIGLIVGICANDTNSSSNSELIQHKIDCANVVKSKLNYPSTYKENNLASLSESETINGTDKITIYFEAKNAFGVNRKYKARCIFDNTKNEMTYFNIKEDY